MYTKIKGGHLTDHTKLAHKQKSKKKKKKKKRKGYRVEVQQEWERQTLPFLEVTSGLTHACKK
jgi:hypothetical protein